MLLIAHSCAKYIVQRSTGMMGDCDRNAYTQFGLNHLFPFIYTKRLFASSRIEYKPAGARHMH